MKSLKLFSLALTMLMMKFAFASDQKTCGDGKILQSIRSEEIQKLVQEDQKDREGSWDSIDWEKVRLRDESRRKRIGEIFGEGCITTAEDYAASALIYQHGNIPDHFFQTFLWSKKAVDLGATQFKRRVALGADRYLVNTGRKQLFATQATRGMNEPCFCLEPVEESFTDAQRKLHDGNTIAEALSWVASLNANTTCGAPLECKKELKSPNKGDIPGVW